MTLPAFACVMYAAVLHPDVRQRRHRPFAGYLHEIISHHHMKVR
jgi:hypothetical protein